MTMAAPPDTSIAAARRPGARLSWPLYWTILSIFIAIVGVITTALTWVNYSKTNGTAMLTAERIFSDVRASVSQQQSSLFAPLISAVSIFGEGRQLGEADFDAMTAPFLAMAALYPQIFDIYAGYENGRHIDVFSFTRDGEAASVGAPPDTRFAIHVVSPGPGKLNAETWRFLDENRVEVGHRTGETDYDPRARPWYKQAWGAAGKPVKSPPYLFVNPAAVGLTFARSFSGTHAGVVAVDITMDHMSQFLRQFKTSDKRTIFMFDGAGMLTAHGTPEKVTRIEAGPDGTEVVQARIEDLNNPVADAMLAHYRAQGPFALGRTDVGGTTYLTTVTAMPTVLGQMDYLAFAAPIDEFAGSILDAARQSLLWALLIVLAFVPVIVFVSGRISRPLKLLVRETDNIRRLALTEPVNVESRITEIHDLAESVANMKQALTQMSKFVPKALVQDLIRSGASMDVGGERRRLSLLLTDVRDFTPISEAATPEDLMTQMSEYFDSLVRVVLQHEGTVDKFVGDAIFSYWNAPLLQPDHEVLACRTALACRAASNARNEEWRLQGRAIWHTRFGIHAGDAVVGNVGSSDRIDYTAIGNAVNIAARLEGLNKYYGTQILVSEPVKEQVGTRFLFRFLDLVKPKGAARPMRVYELIASYDPADQQCVTPEQEGLCAAWAETYKTYDARDWYVALNAFENFAAAHPKDRVARIYLERIISFIVEPPPADWDGVTSFAQK